MGLGPGEQLWPLQAPTLSGLRCLPARAHSDIHLAALPPEHTVVFLLRLLPDTPREAFALWQMTAEDSQPVLGVLLDGQSGGSTGCGS